MIKQHFPLKPEVTYQGNKDIIYYIFKQLMDLSDIKENYDMIDIRVDFHAPKLYSNNLNEAFGYVEWH